MRELLGAPDRTRGEEPQLEACAAPGGLKSAALRVLLGVLGSATVLLVAAGGCQTPQKAAPSPTRWDQTRLQAALQIAGEHIAAGKFDRARGVLAAFCHLPNPRLRLTQARMDVEEGHYAAALQRLDAIAQPTAEAGSPRGPKPAALPAYHHLRGVALEGLGRWGAAAAAYGKAYELEPIVHLLTARLDALVLDERAEAARRILEDERQRFPGQPAIHLLAARLCRRTGDIEAAIGELETAALAQPDSLGIRRRLAEMYTAAGRYAEAAATWQELVAASRDADERHRFRGRLAECLMSAGRVEEARSVYRAVVLTQPADEAARLGLAATCLATGEPAEALQAALKVLRADGDNADARLIAALSYYRLNQPAGAIEMLSGVRTGDDSGGMIRELLARWQ